MSQFPCPFCSSLISGDALICRVCGYRLKIDKGLTGTESVNDQYRIPQWQVDQRFEQQFPGSLSKAQRRANKKRFGSKRRVRVPGSIQSWDNSVTDTSYYQPPRGDRNALLNLSFIFLAFLLIVFSAAATSLLQTFTWILPAVILLICLFVTLISFTSPQLKQDFVLNPYIMWRSFQPYRFISAGFSHINLGHLALNAFSIISFGPYLLEGLIDYFGDLGPLVFTLFFLISVVVADVPDLIWHRKNPYYSSVGASGGGAAIIAAAVVLFPDLTVSPGIPGVLFVIGYFIVSVALAFRKNSQLAHLAHATGTAFGVAVGLLLTTTAGFVYNSASSSASISKPTVAELLRDRTGVAWTELGSENQPLGIKNVHTFDSCSVWEMDSEANAEYQANSNLITEDAAYYSWFDWIPEVQTWVILFSPSPDYQCTVQAAQALTLTLSEL